MDLDSQVKSLELSNTRSFPRLCDREEREVLWEQLGKQERGQPGDVCPSLLQETSLHPLDSQPDLPGRKVLAENFERWKSQVHDRFKLRSEIVRRQRILSPGSHERSSSGNGKL